MNGLVSGRRFLFPAIKKYFGRPKNLLFQRKLVLFVRKKYFIRITIAIIIPHIYCVPPVVYPCKESASLLSRHKFDTLEYTTAIQVRMVSLNKICRLFFSNAWMDEQQSRRFQADIRCTFRILQFTPSANVSQDLFSHSSTQTFACKSPFKYLCEWVYMCQWVCVCVNESYVCILVRIINGLKFLILFGVICIKTYMSCYRRKERFSCISHWL